MIRVFLVEKSPKDAEFASLVEEVGGVEPAETGAPGALRRALDEESDGFDAVCLPGDTPELLELGREAVARRKHVYFHSRFRGDLELARGIEERARRSGVHVGIERPWRWDPEFRAASETLASGRLGELVLVRLHRWGGGFRPALETALDLARLLYGADPESVYASGSPEEYVQVHLKFPGGSMALIDIAPRLPGGAAYGAMTLIGTRGAAYADDHRNVQLLFSARGTLAERTPPGCHPRHDAWRAFVEAVESGERNTKALEELRAVERLYAAVLSAALAREVHVRRGDAYVR